MAPRDPEPSHPPNAQPSENEARERVEAAAEKMMPSSNVGGASPTPLGRDSGGMSTGADDLAHMATPEPPEPAEEEALHVSEDEGGAPRTDEEAESSSLRRT